MAEKINDPDEAGNTCIGWEFECLCGAPLEQEQWQDEPEKCSECGWLWQHQHDCLWDPEAEEEMCIDWWRLVAPAIDLEVSDG